MTGRVRGGELTTTRSPALLPRPLGGQFARFVAVGASNTALTLASYALLLALGLHYLGALVPSFLLGTLNGYTLNRAWTFHAGSFQRAALARYMTTQLAALGLNALMLVTFVEFVGMSRLLAQVLAMPIVSCLTFVVSRRWVFAGRSASVCRCRAPRGSRHRQ
jgi:putative flippase GtrA